MVLWNWVRELCKLAIFAIWAKIAEVQRAGSKSVQASPYQDVEFPKKYTKNNLYGGPTGLSPYRSSLDSLYSDSIPLYGKDRLNYKHGLDAYEA